MFMFLYTITITLNNLSAEENKELEILLTGKDSYEIIEANVVTSNDIHTHNTFDAPEQIKEESFDSLKVEGNKVCVNLPAASVVEIRVK